MFEYFIVVCVLAGDPQGVECKRIAGPFYERETCIEELLKQVVTTGTATCKARYVEIFNAVEKGQQPKDNQQEHIRT